MTLQCTTVGATPIALDGSGSNDPDGDVLSYAWIGPFPEGGGTVTGANPTVTLPLGTYEIALTVNDGELSSQPYILQISITIGVAGLFNPMASLVPEGGLVNYPKNAFKQGRTIPLKLRMSCGATNLTNGDTSPPRIVALTRVGDAQSIPIVDIDSGSSNDNGSLFRFSGDQWIFNLSTTGISTGRYVITIEMSDGLRYEAGFDLR